MHQISQCSHRPPCWIKAGLLQRGREGKREMKKGKVRGGKGRGGNVVFQ